MNTELLEALTILEKEKNISKDVMMEAIVMLPRFRFIQKNSGVLQRRMQKI